MNSPKILSKGGIRDLRFTCDEDINYELWIHMNYELSLSLSLCFIDRWNSGFTIHLWWRYKLWIMNSYELWTLSLSLSLCFIDMKTAQLIITKLGTYLRVLKKDTYS